MKPGQRRKQKQKQKQKLLTPAVLLERRPKTEVEGPLDYTLRLRRCAATLRANGGRRKRGKTPRHDALAAATPLRTECAPRWRAALPGPPLKRRAGGGKARRVACMDASQFGVSPWMDCRQTPQPDREPCGQDARKARKRGGLSLWLLSLWPRKEKVTRSPLAIESSCSEALRVGHQNKGIAAEVAPTEGPSRGITASRGYTAPSKRNSAPAGCNTRPFRSGGRKRSPVGLPVASRR
jgi:hypothetical protein